MVTLVDARDCFLDYDGGGIPSDGGGVAQGRQACCSRCDHTYTARVNGRRVNVWFGRQGSRYRPSVQTDDLNHACLVTNKCPTRSFVDDSLVDLALHGYDLQHTPRIGIQTWQSPIRRALSTCQTSSMKMHKGLWLRKHSTDFG
ncbi:hypothetical protein [Paraburkholderia hospita]|uniref:hypothetical protein n=1 Tax=Paraburkholderia hospita TaxID=169430 RepID=UPI0010551ECB|nr:hypothetical protein [Paraburkholderia hospita]